MSTNKLTRKPDKTEFLLIGNERQQSKYLSMFPIELLGVKTNPAKSARNLGVIFDKMFTFRSHISAVCAHAFTICRICGVFAVTLIWIVQSYLQLLVCPVVSIIAIHFCMVLLALTSQGFKRVQNQYDPILREHLEQRKKTSTVLLKHNRERGHCHHCRLRLHDNILALLNNVQWALPNTTDKKVNIGTCKYYILYYIPVNIIYFCSGLGYGSRA